MERLGKKYRVKHRKDIRRIFARGRRTADATLTLLAIQSDAPGAAPARLMTAVSTRHGNAVMRNRIKRLCREAFRKSRPKLAPGWDYAVVPRVGAKFTLPAIQSSLESLATRLTKPKEQDK